MVFISITPVIAQPPANDVEALERYIQIGLENNAGLKAGALEVESVRLSAPQFSRLDNPMIEMEYDAWSRDDMNRFSLMFMQSVPWFGTLESNRQYFDRLADAQSSTLRKIQNELVRDIRLSWYDMHEIYHHIYSINENIELLETIERQILSRIEGGRASQVDLIRIEIEREELTSIVAEKEDQLESEKYRFNALLNRNHDAEVYLFYFPEKPEIPEVTDLNQNPEISELDFRMQAAESDRKRAWLEGFPDFRLGLGMMSRDIGFYDPDRINAVMVRLDISLPVYRKRINARQQQARVMTQNIIEARRDRVTRIEADFRRLEREVGTAARNIELYQDRLIPAVRRALDISLENYISGGTGFEEIIQLQRSLIDLEMKYYEAETTRNKAITEMDYLAGKPVTTEN